MIILPSNLKNLIMDVAIIILPSNLKFNNGYCNNNTSF